MKLFTIMIYEDGSNELEFEIDKRYKELLRVTPREEINVVLQTSKVNRDIAKLLRPGVDFSTVESFKGCRRYDISRGTNEMVEDLGSVNMAQPKVLKEFIQWAAKEFPAQRYILIIGGHGFEFVGMITDYSENLPYLMGFPQLSRAIVEACIERDIFIDILILDTCYANNTETFYELGRYKEEYIKYLITYTFWGNIKGLSYSSVVNILAANIRKENYYIVLSLSEELMKANEDFPIMAIKLDCRVLNLLKNLYSTLGLLYLYNRNYELNKITPFNLLTATTEGKPWEGVRERICKISKLIIVFDGDCVYGGQKILPMKVLCTQIKEAHKQRLYSGLAFTKDNYWFNLLCNLDINNRVNSSSKAEEPPFEPTPLCKNILFSYISSCNNQLSNIENWDIVNSLITLNSWDL